MNEQPGRTHGGWNRRAQHRAGLILVLALGWVLATLVAWAAEHAAPPGNDPLWYAPLGNLIESVCWLISLVVRLRAEPSQAAERLVREVTHDALTGLPNRTWITAGAQSSWPR